MRILIFPVEAFTARRFAACQQPVATISSGWTEPESWLAHHFQTIAGQTLMKDTFDYTSPFGIIGRIADFMFLKRYMSRLIRTRNGLIKSVAESGKACWLGGMSD